MPFAQKRFDLSSYYIACMFLNITKHKRRTIGYKLDLRKAQHLQVLPLICNRIKNVNNSEQCVL